MWKRISGFLRDLITRPEYRKIRYVFLFLFLTLLIHFFWRFWERTLHYYPIGDWMRGSVKQTIVLLYHQTSWVLDHVFQIQFRQEPPVLWFENGAGISVNAGCSGFKQIAQFALLFLFFPGSRIQKLWFIPAGMVIVYLTNLFRLTFVSLVLVHIPQYAHPMHDYVMRSLFYVVIFCLWLLWINKIGGRKIREFQKPA